MARPRNEVPTYRRHKQSGQAIVTVNVDGERKDILLGTYGSEKSKAEYKRVLELIGTSDGTKALSLKSNPASESTVNELLLAYIQWSDRIRRTTPDKVHRGGTDARFTTPTVSELFGDLQVSSFGPKCLKRLREVWVAAGLSRKVINGRTGMVRRIFRWGVSEEIVRVEVYDSLKTVEGLRAGQTDAPDRMPVKPADMSDVEKVLGYLRPMLRALLVVQLHSGARAGELMRLKVGDIDRSNAEAWSYHPATHKGTWKGKARVIYFGARCREALAPLLLKAGGPDEFVFSPRRAEAERIADRAATRKTPKYPSHMKRNASKRVGAQRKRPPGERYSTPVYRRAIERACEKAGVPVFTPHRLRHLAATRVRAEMGVDAARALLGHSLAAVTEIYSKEVDKQLALKAVERFG